MSVTGGDEVRHEGSHPVDDAVEVDLGRPLHVAVRLLPCRQTRRDDAGVIAHNVDPPEGPHNIGSQRQERLGVADIDDPRVPEPVSEGASPAATSERAQAYRQLAQAMDSLSESLRTTMVLACVEQLPYKDIAQVLGCSEGTVAWRVHEARRKLREAIGDDVLLAFEEP